MNWKFLIASIAGLAIEFYLSSVEQNRLDKLEEEVEKLKKEKVQK